MLTTTRSTAARALAIAGTVLAGLPLVAPVVLMIVFLIAGGGFHFDFLLPGELFLVVVAGGAVLFAAALLTRRHRRLVGALLAAVGLLFFANAGLAAVTGLASGRTAAEGWPLVVVAGSYAIYVAAVVALFAVGVILCRELFRPIPSSAP